MKTAVVLALVLLCAAPAAAQDTGCRRGDGAGRHPVPGGLMPAFIPPTGCPMRVAGRGWRRCCRSSWASSSPTPPGRATVSTRRNKGSPPLLEGDLFTSLFEGATAWKVGACGGDAATGRCAVALRYDAAGLKKPVTWTDTFYLVAVPGGWRVDDIGYGAGFAFGNTGRLSDTLKSVLAMAP